MGSIAAAVGPVLLIGGRLFKMAGSLVGTFGKVGKAIGSIGKKTKGMSAPLKEGSSVMSAAARMRLDSESDSQPQPQACGY